MGTEVMAGMPVEGTGVTLPLGQATLQVSPASSLDRGSLLVNHRNNKAHRDIIKPLGTEAPHPSLAMVCLVTEHLAHSNLKATPPLLLREVTGQQGTDLLRSHRAKHPSATLNPGDRRQAWDTPPYPLTRPQGPLYSTASSSLVTGWLYLTHSLNYRI